MKDLHVLWLGRKDEYRLTSHLRYIREELEGRVKVSKYGWRWPTFKESDFEGYDALIPVEKHKPDALIIAHGHSWINLDKVNIPKFHWWGDPHHRRGKRIEWANKSKMDVILHPCYGAKSWGMEYLESRLDAKSALFPTAVDVNIVKDYNLPKIYDVLIIGRSGRPIYPLRYQIRLVLESPEIAEKYNVKWQRRPKNDYGWTKEKMELGGIVGGESYARLICQSKVVPFGTSVYRYAGAKIFEIMATNTLAMFNPPYNPDRYHLFPGENFVEVDKHNFRDKLVYYVENEDERKKIAQKGYNLVQKHHSAQVRVTHLINLIEEELG